MILQVTDVETTDRMLTTEQAAAFMKLSPSTIRQYVTRGLMTVGDQIGGAFLFSESECRRYLRERRPRGNPTFQKKRKSRRK